MYICIQGSPAIPQGSTAEIHPRHRRHGRMYKIMYNGQSIACLKREVIEGNDLYWEPL